MTEKFGGNERNIDAKGLTQRQQDLMKSEAYRLSSNDPDLLGLDELRSVRLQLEYLKADLLQTREGIQSTIVVFGSARLRAKEAVEADLETARNAETVDVSKISDLEKQLRRSDYYEEARRFAKIVSQRFHVAGRPDFVVVTGGGPGIMEAANRGADEAGARSIGLNIDLPKEQIPNPYISPELCFRFRYFGLRKMHFLMRAKALVAFPGGFGTLDEVFDVLTLVQTKKIDPIPIILVGSAYWNRVVDFEFLVEEGFVAPDDLSLFTVVDTAVEAVHVICEFYNKTPPSDSVMIGACPP
ncbi:3-isopropylmalate dehydrogenase [Algimonas arctica]|uniref:Cytokinin riboside 5'-monophosphate phosphoribohydrolase n=1 Tax=Algimonas arctica TaxID=1479486 RepID=A0A8J3CR02_9PROT|nr:TIGR00730 family Rossman fold protein [Algimonas arctica]GHA88650.1 3-isopropylmalate dehydrogenase [Algimonas arctica]